ncbi:MAG: hypothetical protein CM15mP120_03350 [Pseudomonadota bacterium]|nr:MAG: hypothetical protein CM15mP120_03350 [Pseudomonadota bacterium]
MHVQVGYPSSDAEQKYCTWFAMKIKATLMCHPEN